MYPDEVGEGFDRRSYILRQRELHGRKSVCVMPGYVPPAVLTALDLLTVELWAPSGSTTPGRLPSYVCSVAQQVMRFLSTDGASAVDALVFPSLCDSLTGVGSVHGDLAPLNRPLIFYQPDAARCLATAGRLNTEHQAYRRAELDLLVQGLERVAGQRLQPERLQQALELHAEADSLVRELYACGASRVLGERRVMELMRSGEYLHVSDYIDVLQGALEQVRAAAPQEVDERLPVLLSGLVPEPMELLDALEEAGLRVAGDDLLCLGRRMPRPRQLDGETDVADPRAHLLALDEQLPPAPTRPGRAQDRVSWLLSEVRRCGARGVVALVVKFCEPELFELPTLRSGLEDARVPLLVVEHELGLPPSGQTRTRLEAFKEMLQGAARAGDGPWT